MKTNGNECRISFGFGGTIMDELKLAYLAGIKVGIESLVRLEAVVEKTETNYLSNLSN